jgi:hypothetical protein
MAILGRCKLSVDHDLLDRLSKTTPISTKAGVYQPDDYLLTFLKGL